MISGVKNNYDGRTILSLTPPWDSDKLFRANPTEKRPASYIRGETEDRNNRAC